MISLIFSKIEEGKLVVENIEFRLDDVLKQVADITCLKAEEKGLEILFRVPPNVPTRLKGDPVRIGQIITNYLNNAIKFTNEGEIELAIEVLGSTPTGVHLRFCVTDTGVGLKKQEIKKMFQSFSQADDSTTREFGGTGLGLAICKQLSELMNGDCWSGKFTGRRKYLLVYGYAGNIGRGRNRSWTSLLI